MKTSRIIAIAALVATTGLALHVAQAQQVGARRIDLQRHDLSVAGREVIQVIVELEPGTTAPRHSHPGEEIIYVLEGTWEYTLEGKPPVTLKAGDVLFIPAGTVHSARNVGSGRGAELATYIVEKDPAPGARQVIMDVSLLTLGAQAPDLALTLNRVALGLFFMISGYHSAVAARLPT